MICYKPFCEYIFVKLIKRTSSYVLFQPSLVGHPSGVLFTMSSPIIAFLAFWFASDCDFERMNCVLIWRDISRGKNGSLYLAAITIFIFR